MFLSAQGDMLRIYISRSQFSCVGGQTSLFSFKCLLPSLTVCMGVKMKDGRVMFMMDFIALLCLDEE